MVEVVRVGDYERLDGDIVFYIGRACYGKPESVLHNPYKGERTQAIAKYREYATDAMQTNPRFRGQVELLAKLHQQGRTVKLECWCAPLPCHGDVIKDLILTDMGASPSG